MAYTEAQKTALQTAIASGVLRINYEGKTIEYRNMAELKAALAEVTQSLATQAGTTIHRHVKITASKGL